MKTFFALIAIIAAVSGLELLVILLLQVSWINVFMELLLTGVINDIVTQINNVKHRVINNVAIKVFILN